MIEKGLGCANADASGRSWSSKIVAPKFAILSAVFVYVRTGLFHVDLLVPVEHSVREGKVSCFHCIRETEGCLGGKSW